MTRNFSTRWWPRRKRSQEVSVRSWVVTPAMVAIKVVVAWDKSRRTIFLHRINVPKQTEEGFFPSSLGKQIYKLFGWRWQCVKKIEFAPCKYGTRRLFSVTFVNFPGIEVERNKGDSIITFSRTRPTIEGAVFGETVKQVRNLDEKAQVSPPAPAQCKPRTEALSICTAIARGSKQENSNDGGTHGRAPIP